MGNPRTGRQRSLCEVIPLDGKAIDKALGLKAISIRLQTNMIDELKAIAARDGIGYQPLIKRVLARFIEEEQKANSPTILKAN